MTFRPLPTLNAAWRTASPDDREKVRQYAELPATQTALHSLTVAMNELAEVSPATVPQIQAWIDEVESLESDWADRIADGTAHLGNAKAYKGPVPGRTITEDDRQTKADVLEWDSDLLKVEIEAGAAGMEGPVLAGRIAELKNRVIQALGLECSRSSWTGTLVRS